MDNFKFKKILINYGDKAVEYLVFWNITRMTLVHWSCRQNARGESSGYARTAERLQEGKSDPPEHETDFYSKSFIEQGKV